MATNPLHLNLPNYVQGGSQSPIDTSPVASTTNVSAAQILLERSDIDKSLKSLENLVSLLYDYAQLWQSLVKAFKDAGSLKRSTTAVDGLEWPAQVFMNSASIFDAVSEVDSKYSKLVEREYESCTQELKKWLKKLKKEDKALDEYTAAANAKIKAAGMAYEKKSKKGITSSPSGPSLDSYSALLSSLTSAVNNAKHQHTLFTSSKHVSILYSTSGGIGRIADAQWMKTCELLRKAAVNVGPLGEGRSYVESGWKGGHVADLPLNLPVNAMTGSTNGLEAQRITANDNAHNPLINAPPVPTFGRPIISPGLNQASSSATPTLKSAPTLSTNYLDEVAQELRTSLALPEPSKAENKGTIQRQKNPDTKGNDLKQPEMPLNLRTETISEASTKEPKPAQMDEASSPTVPSSKHTTHSTATTDTNITNSRTTQSTNTSAKDTATISSSASKASIEEKPTQTPLPPPPEEAAIFEPRHTLARTPLNTESKDKEEKNPAPKDSVATSAPVKERQTPASIKDSEAVTTYFPLVNKEKIDKNESQAQFTGLKQPIRSNSSYPQGAMSQVPPQLPHTPMSYAGRPVGRTMSIDSTTSNGSHVAAMRDRYNAGSPPLPSPHVSTRPGEMYVPRDREGGRVSDMASRFTPIDGPPRVPTSQARENRIHRPPYAPQSPSARWAADTPPLSDTLPIRTPITHDSIDEFGTTLSSMPAKARDTMPNPDRRHQPTSGVKSQTLGAAGVLSTPYDIQLSELELQQREMELEIHRQRLQLVKDREALLYRERGRAYQEDADASDYAGGRESRGHARYSRNIDANRDGYGDPYERAGPREAYDTPNRDPYNTPGRYGYERDRGRYEPNLGSQTPVEAAGPSSYRNRAYTADSRPSESPQRSHVDLSSGLGVLGLGLPPGAGPSARLGAPSKESLPLSGQSTQNLVPPSLPTGEGSSTTKGPSPRRSADAISPAAGTLSTKGNEKEKGGTWIGRGLKRFSMPLGAGPNS
ncbi:hypothetical protein CPB86DRAFT_816887 [Serendipita vermifera]|nr:hypothetical protein CPB86DRAFT_816887 [Serendipita vermifera]